MSIGKTYSSSFPVAVNYSKDYYAAKVAIDYWLHLKETLFMATTKLCTVTILLLVLTFILNIQVFAQARFSTDNKHGAYYGLGLVFTDDADAEFIEVGVTTQGRIDFGGVFGRSSSLGNSTFIFGETMSLYPLQQFLDKSGFSVSVDQSAIFSKTKGTRSGVVGNLTFSIGGSIFTSLEIEPKLYVQPTVGVQWTKTPGDLEDNVWSPYAGITFVIRKSRGGAVGLGFSVAKPNDSPTTFGLSVSNFVLNKNMSTSD